MNTATRENIIPKLRAYFATQPIERAWLFGSFSRGEETETSDVDILVDFDKDARIGLFKYAGIYGDLKELLTLVAELELEFNSPTALEAPKLVSVLTRAAGVL